MVAIIFYVCVISFCIYFIYTESKIIREKKQKDKRTEQYGNYYYGRIVKIDVLSYDQEHDIRTYGAEVCFYCREEMRVRKVSDKCGYNKFEYPIGSYVKIKYYDDDINFDEDSANVTGMPENIKQFLKEKTDPMIEEELKAKPNFY